MNLLQNDFECLGQIAKHCNWSQLCIAVNRAKEFDVMPLICYDTWKKISDSYTEWQASIPEQIEGEPPVIIPEWEYDLLWNGGEYKGCGGKIKYHSGLKKMWIYFSYAQYVIESADKDTPTGRKILDNDFSIPVQMKDLITIEKKYRSMAFEIWEGIKSYLCSTGERNDCEDCGCDDGGCGNTKKISGIKSKAVYR